MFALLAGVFYVGHQTGWKMPKFSELFGSPPKTAEDWCAEHLVPESICVECNDELLPRAKVFGLCRVHGVMECVICHPDLAQVSGDPRLPGYDTAKAIAIRDRPENNSRNTLHKMRVQFASQESAAKAGIDVDVVAERPMSDTLAANGEVVFDPTRVAHLSSRVPGTIAAVLKTVGDDVRAGDILALVDSAAVGQAKAQLIQASVQVQLKRTNVERLRTAGGGVPGKLLTEAESALQEAEIAFLSARQSLMNLGFDVPDDLELRDPKAIGADLRLLGIPKSCLADVPAGSRTANLIAVIAPYDGVVVKSDVVAGEVVDATTLLFTVADPQHLWLTLNVRQEDVKYLSHGEKVVFQTDDSAQQVAGKISWISPTIDEHTRTLQVRVKLENADGKLRDGTFGTARIVLREEPRAVVVPREAVQSTSDAHFVFVRDRDYLTEGHPKVFHVRQVRIGAGDDQSVELLAGALPGEVVATKGSGVLLAQLLKSTLGAGCGCHKD
ncbi:MAG TPA: efflux RND transporter periplasmic adaptor subunit [Planctomycetaceae bacterium]